MVSSIVQLQLHLNTQMQLHRTVFDVYSMRLIYYYHDSNYLITLLHLTCVLTGGVYTKQTA
jgi:hypothetical protein